MSIAGKNPETGPQGAAPGLSDPRQWGPMLDLECELALELSVPGFTIADLLRLQPETVLDTKWTQGQDVPVRVNGELLAWAEFEVVDGQLAMRITEWA